MRFIALLVGSILLLVGVTCSSQVTLTGNFVDSFSAPFAPQVTFHPLQLYSTNGSTPLYVDRVLRPSSTNASYSYSTAGEFIISNLVCGLWQVSATGASQSLYILAQLGTTLTNFNGILTNNFLYTNSGLSLVAGSNVVFTFANGGVLTISSTGGGGGSATNLTPWNSPINGAGYSLSNVSAVDIVGTGAAQALHFVNDNMVIGDSSGKMAFFDPTSPQYYFGGSMFGDALGTINAAGVIIGNNTNTATAGAQLLQRDTNGKEVAGTSLNISYLTNALITNAQPISAKSFLGPYYGVSNNWFNWGVKSDGITDDTAAISNAFNWAAQNNTWMQCSSNSGVAVISLPIFVAGGFYNGFKLYGNATIMQSTAHLDGIVFTNIGSAPAFGQNLQIDGLTLTCAAQEPVSSSASAIKFAQGPSFANQNLWYDGHIQHLRIHNFATGIYQQTNNQNFSFEFDDIWGYHITNSLLSFTNASGGQNGNRYIHIRGQQCGHFGGQFIVMTHQDESFWDQIELDQDTNTVVLSILGGNGVSMGNLHVESGVFSDASIDYRGMFEIAAVQDFVDWGLVHVASMTVNPPDAAFIFRDSSGSTQATNVYGQMDIYNTAGNGKLYGISGDWNPGFYHPSIIETAVTGYAGDVFGFSGDLGANATVPGFDGWTIDLFGNLSTPNNISSWSNIYVANLLTVSNGATIANGLAVTGGATFLGAASQPAQMIETNDATGTAPAWLMRRWDGFGSPPNYDAELIALDWTGIGATLDFMSSSFEPIGSEVWATNFRVTPTGNSNLVSDYGTFSYRSSNSFLSIGSSGVSPNFQLGVATDTESAGFNFGTPFNVAFGVVPPYCLLLISNSSSSPILGNFRNEWTNNWTNGGGGPFAIPGNTTMPFFFTIVPGLLTNVSWPSPITGSGGGSGTIFLPSMFSTNAYSPATVVVNNLGGSAGTNLVSGGSLSNLYIGQAGNTTGTGGTNVGIGVNVLQKLTSGGTNVAVGFNALAADTTGYENTAVGDFALAVETTQPLDTAVGYNALVKATTGTGNNTAIGGSAGSSLTTGSFNTIMGEGAVANGTATGSENSALGGNVLRTLSSGNYNTASGFDSMETGTVTGNSNTANGSYSLFNVSSGSNNTAIGTTAGASLTAGSYNTLLGWNTMSNGAANLTGFSNLVLGANSGTQYGSGESNNVLLANIGVAGDQGWIRIGTDGVQTNWHMAGNGSTLFVVATNGISTLNTNVLLASSASSWSGQFATINSGFTNTYGTNCTININGSIGYFVFYKCGGVSGANVAANPLFTNALSTNGWSRTLQPNCGVQVVAGIGNANVAIDF